MSDFSKRMEEDKEFADKIHEANGPDGRALIRAAGYEVKDAAEFIHRVQNDPDFMEAISDLETVQDKMTLIMTEGFYFTQEELNAAQEKIAEEEFDTLAGAGCGLYIEGHCAASCEPESWGSTGCDSYFKCTWG